MSRVLIADSQPSVQLALTRVLDRAGYGSKTASNLAELRISLQDGLWDAVLAADDLADAAEAEGLDLGRRLIRLRDGDTDGPAGPGVDKRRGIEELPRILAGLLGTSSRPGNEREIAVAPLSTRPPNGRAACPSQAWKLVEERIAVYAQHELPVLIQGESGSGKEVVARALHEEGPRKGRPFVAIHCGAIPAELLESELFGHARGSFTGAHRDRPGRFEAAADGTLLLDEIGEMSPALQAKLLRALEIREFQPVGGSRPRALRARVLAATHRDLEQMLAEGTFRRDLLHRLRVGHIEIAPLRERPEDLEPLCALFLAACRDELQPALLGLDAGAWARLRSHGWPGNARELFNLLRQATVLASEGVIGEEQLEGLRLRERSGEEAKGAWLAAANAEIRRREALGLSHEAALAELQEELKSLRDARAERD